MPFLRAFSNSTGPAGDSSARKHRRISLLPVPAFGYEPETKAYIGALCLATWRFGRDSNTRPSNAKVEVNYTQRKQFINEVVWNIFLPKEKYFTSGKIHFSKFPDYYWGSLPNTPESNKTGFSSMRFTTEFFFLRNLGKSWFLGPVLRYVKYTKLSFQSGLMPVYNELKVHEAIGIPGITVSRDTRNNILLAEKGMYFFVQPLVMYKPREAYLRIQLDLRKYFSIGKKNTLSTQIKSVLSTCSNPLDMAVFGGDAVARGFYAGRFRTPFYATVQAEWRRTIYRRWGMAAFGGTSAISGEDLLAEAPFLYYNFGGGIRFRIDRKENINMRVDYAVGSGKQSGFYVVFGEAF